MHSKVIIASLACVLAASFNCDRGIAPVAAENNEAVAKETISRAPNDYQKNYWFSEQEGDAGYQFSVRVEYEKEYQGFEILSNERNVYVSYSFYDDYADITLEAPTSDGPYVIQFGYRSGSKNVVLTTIYIYVKLGNYAASVYSIDDAKSRLFRYQETSYDVLDKISYRDGFNYASGYYNAYDPYRYSAEQRCANYVYSGTNDVVTDFLSFTGTGSSNIKLILHTTWVDSNGHYHPLVGVRADFIANYSLLGQGDLHFTDSEGKYAVDLPRSQATGLLVNNIKCRVSAVSKATSVEDYHYQNYPICYTAPYGTALSNYTQFDIFMYIYSARSDRGGAYEITQAQSVPYNYVDAFVDTLDTTITRFPSAHTDYVSNRYYNFIDIQKEDVHSWDVISHEYGHFICDQLSLCEIDTSRNPHNVHDDLGEYGMTRAYSEGLATYLGIAAQMYSSSAYTNIPGFADEVYNDSYRDFSVNYSLYKPAVSGGSTHIYGERIESSVTSVLLKMLDNVSRTGDNVALGHSDMWNIIINTNYADSIVELIDAAINQYSSSANSIKTLRNREDIADYLIPNYGRAEWTIMMYICGSNLQSPALSDIAEVLKVTGQPSNVNIIMEIGGSTSWDYSANKYGISASYLNRYHVRNKQLISDGKIAQANMGAQSTFEDFMDWGLRNYPAKKTGVILWNHGGGLSGCCSDKNYGDNLSNKETYDALGNSFYKNRISEKLEFIGYDACLMQVQDVADFNSKYFNYMIASEETVPESGWDYDDWLPTLYAKNSTDVILKKICDTYIGSGWSFNTLSYLNLSYMSEYKNRFENLANSITTTVKANVNSFVDDILYRLKGFDYESRGLSDALDFLNKLQADSKYSSFYTQIANTKSSYNKLVEYSKTGWWYIGEAHGLSLFTGFNFDDGGVTLSYSSSNTGFNNWRSLITWVTANYTPPTHGH